MADHLAHGVSDLRLRALPAYFDELLEVVDLPLARDEIVRLRAFAPRLSELCDELATCGVPETILHDDLHHANVFADGNCLRVLDWGDASISHPFASLVVTFRFLEERTRLAVDDAWFARLRDAHLEAVGPRPQARVRARAPRWRFGAVRCLLAASTRHRGGRTAPFDSDFAIVLRRALAQTADQAIRVVRVLVRQRGASATSARGWRLPERHVFRAGWCRTRGDTDTRPCRAVDLTRAHLSRR